VCKFWINNACFNINEDGTNYCKYAHGTEEKREAGIRCIRIIHDNGEMTVEGCRQVGHCLAECPTGGGEILEDAVLPKQSLDE